MDSKPEQSKILVIDDEIGVRESLRMVLKNDYEIFCADRVDAGIELLREKKPDLIIMDIRMPEKTGIEGLREIREIDPHVSIIMLTGYGALDTAQEAIRHGANDYLEKPFDTDEIQQVIKKYVERSKFVFRKRTAQEELQKLTQSLGREVGQKNKMTTLGAASSELVRDLRNPLTIIRGYLDLLSYELKEKSGSASPDMDEYLDQIEKNVERCTELVESWRALGKFDYSQMNRLDLPKILADCVREAEREVLDVAFETEFDGTEEQFEILGERAQIKRAFQNIIDNAAQAVAGRESPCIRVSGKKDAEGIEIQIRDNGYGVDTRELQWIFEPLDTAASIEKGTGLGLFITKKVIEEHQGTLKFESRINEGTIVTICLPQAHIALGYYSRPDSFS
ncbi:MAG: hybrid sensor histidine kinase/response regulator [Kiritimatiellales bacterium]|nr:hybrid sensor histidine kinase/response regulator [Kiritimatiellales bacterium]